MHHHNQARAYTRKARHEYNKAILYLPELRRRDTKHANAPQENRGTLSTLWPDIPTLHTPPLHHPNHHQSRTWVLATLRSNSDHITTHNFRSAS